MKKVFTILILCIVISSCKDKVAENDIPKLNGYWEIEKTVSAAGEKKDYKVNETIDYFEIKINKGFRKKVMPQLDGTYVVNNQKEEIRVFEDEGHFFIMYVTPYGKWKDQIIEISENELILKDEQGLEYYYKRPIPFSVK